MSDNNEDDKPTVVLDLNSLKKQKLQQEEELAQVVSELEFNVSEDEDSSLFQAEAPKPSLKLVFFDFQSNYFESSRSFLPEGHDYKFVKDLAALNESLKNKEFQIVVFNYDANPKAVNQLCAQIKAKFPHTKTIITAKSISPEKAAQHAKTSSGANGYLKLPLEANAFENEIFKVFSESKKAA